MVYELASASVAKPKPPPSISPLVLVSVETTFPSFWDVTVWVQAEHRASRPAPRHPEGTTTSTFTTFANVKQKAEKLERVEVLGLARQSRAIECLRLK